MACFCYTCSVCSMAGLDKKTVFFLEASELNIDGTCHRPVSLMQYMALSTFWLCDLITLWLNLHSGISEKSVDSDSLCGG